MAAKKKKGKKSPAEKEAVGRRQCIPEQIIQLLPKNQRVNPVHYLSSITCTTKAWVPPPTSRCIRSGDRKSPELYRLGNSSNSSSACIRERYFYSYYSTGKASTDGRQIMIYSSDEQIWIRYECAAIDPFDAKRKCVEFTSIVGFRGKFYAMSLQGTLVVIEEIDSRVAIAGIGSNRGVPSVSSRCFEEYLFEFDGEIMLIFFVHKKSMECVDGIEVFRLCFDELKWIKIEKLQGKILFLDLNTSWVNSAEIGCKGDCIYFTQGSDKAWWMYDMETCCISLV